MLANISPKVKTELDKMRPVLIIQDQMLLDIIHPSTLIIPLTTNLIDNTDPLRIRIKAHNQLKKDSDLFIDQIRAIDNKRLIIGPLIRCDRDFMRKIHKAIFEVIGVKIEDFIDSL